MSTATKLKSNVETLLVEWEGLMQRANKIEAQRRADVAKHDEKRDKACAPINSAAIKKLDPLQARMSILATEIDTAMKAGISPDQQTVTVARVETAGAVAEVKDKAVRVIDPKEFLEEMPEADRTPLFYECLDVLIGEAEHFLPKEAMDRLSTTRHNYSTKIRLKK